MAFGKQNKNCPLQEFSCKGFSLLEGGLIAAEMVTKNING